MRFMVAAALLAALGCDNQLETEEQQAGLQAQALEQAHAQVGMPSLSRFQEKRMMRDIYELRDKEITTHAYLLNELSGCLVYLGPAVGYGLPYGTQYTAPTRTAYAHGAYFQAPQPEPNGLYVPETAEGTWLMLRDPTTDAGGARPVYVEPRVVVAPFRLVEQECSAPNDRKQR